MKSYRWLYTVAFFAWIFVGVYAGLSERTIWIGMAIIAASQVMDWSTETAKVIIESLSRIEGYLSRRSDP